jgi:hypothetical protein
MTTPACGHLDSVTDVAPGASYHIVVNHHGGDLSVDSRPGDTRFQVWLPLAEPPSR